MSTPKHQDTDFSIPLLTGADIDAMTEHEIDLFISRIDADMNISSISQMDEDYNNNINNNIYDSQSILIPSSYGQIAHDIKCKKPGITINKSDDIQISTSSAALISKHDRAPILTTDNTTEPAIIRDYKQSQQFIKHQYNIYATNETIIKSSILPILSIASSKLSKGNNINIDRVDGAATYDYDTNKIRHKIWKPTKPTTTKTEPLKPFKHNKSYKARKTNKWNTSNMHGHNNNNNNIIKRSDNTTIHSSITSTVQSTNITSSIPSIPATFEPTEKKKLTLKERKAKKRNASNTTNYRSMTQTQKTTLLKEWNFVHGMNMEDDDIDQSRTVSIWLDDKTNKVIKNWYINNPMMDNDNFYSEPIDCGNNIIIYVRKNWKPTKATLAYVKEEECEQDMYGLYIDEYLDIEDILYCDIGLDLFEEEEEDTLMAVNIDPDTMNDAEFISYLREKYYIGSISDPTPTSETTYKSMLAASNMSPTPPKIIKKMKTPKPPNEYTSKGNINHNKIRYNNTGCYDIGNDKDILTEEYTNQIDAGQVAEVISSSFKNTGAPATKVLTVYIDNVGLSASGNQSNCHGINGYIKENKETNDDMID